MCSVYSWAQCDYFFWQVLLKTSLSSYFVLILKHLVLGKDIKLVTNGIVVILKSQKLFALIEKEIKLLNRNKQVIQNIFNVYIGPAILTLILI